MAYLMSNLNVIHIIEEIFFNLDYPHLKKCMDVNNESWNSVIFKNPSLWLKRHLCADNAFMLLTKARLFDEPQLAALCLETIDKNTPEALGIDLNIRNIFCKPNQKIPLKLYTFQQNISFFRC